MQKIFILNITTQLDGEEREFVAVPFFDKNSALVRADHDVAQFENDYEDNDCVTSVDADTMYCEDCYGNSIFCEIKEMEIEGRERDFVAVSINRFDVEEVVGIDADKLSDNDMQNLANKVGEWLEEYGELGECIKEGCNKLGFD